MVISRLERQLAAHWQWGQRVRARPFVKNTRSSASVVINAVLVPVAIGSAFLPFKRGEAAGDGGKGFLAFLLRAAALGRIA